MAPSTAVSAARLAFGAFGGGIERGRAPAIRRLHAKELPMGDRAQSHTIAGKLVGVVQSGADSLVLRAGLRQANGKSTYSILFERRSPVHAFGERAGDDGEAVEISAEAALELSLILRDYVRIVAAGRGDAYFQDMCEPNAGRITSSDTEGVAKSEGSRVAARRNRAERTPREHSVALSRTVCVG
jgi:hypothetical protein